MTTSSTGGDFLTRRSAINQLGKRMARLSDVLIVDDEAFDSDRLRATLRVIMGYEVTVRSAPTLGSAIDMVLASVPDLVFLDDLLKPSDEASSSIPFLRRANYHGPIIVVSGQATRARHAALLSLGATEVIHKDDLDSVRLTESLVRIFPAV